MGQIWGTPNRHKRFCDCPMSPRSCLKIETEFRLHFFNLFSLPDVDMLWYLFQKSLKAAIAWEVGGGLGSVDGTVETGQLWMATGSSASPSSTSFLVTDSLEGSPSWPMREYVVCPQSLSISPKPRIGAVAWKKGAHQPGKPPIRATTTPHLRCGPPGMDL